MQRHPATHLRVKRMCGGGQAAIVLAFRFAHAMPALPHSNLQSLLERQLFAAHALSKDAQRARDPHFHVRA